MPRILRILTLSTLVAVSLAAAGDSPKPPRLTKPWNQLSTLTDDQKQQIADLHARAREEIRQIEQRERREILNLLTQDQLNQLHDLEDKATVARKLKDAPATQSSDTP